MGGGESAGVRQVDETPYSGDKLELPEKDSQRTDTYVSESFSVQLVASHPL